MANSSLERMIDDLDIKQFVGYFLLPHKPKDLLKNMDEKPDNREEAYKIFEEMVVDSFNYTVNELATLKHGKDIEMYRQTIQELDDNLNLKGNIEKFVQNSYYLLFWIIQRKRTITPTLWFSREKTRRLAKTDYQILKHYHKAIENTQEINSSSTLFLELKNLGSSVIQDENYQISKKVVQDMENYGEAKLGIRYDYFDTVKGLQHIKFNTKEKWKDTLDWYLHKTNVFLEKIFTLGLYLFPTRREKFLVKSLEFLIEKNAASIENILKYRKPMDFFLGATNYIEKARSFKLPLVYPSFNNKKQFLIKELYNPCLLLQENIKGREDMVSNNVEFSPDQNVSIITGPNNTGKTVYVKSIGLAYILAQNGFPISARDAKLIELDGVYTHFIHPEDVTLGEGSYLDELRRIKELFQNATSKTLLIVDEPIRGTSPEDAEEMSLRFIKGFSELKAPTFFTTHLHTVANKVANWKGIKNLQTEVELIDNEIKPTYKISAGEAGKSYGVEIAEKFGLGEEDILNMVRKKEL